MPTATRSRPARLLHDLGVTARRIARVNLLRFAGRLPAGRNPPVPIPPSWAALSGEVGGPVASTHLFEVPANRPPWFDTGIDLAAGEQITWFASGRVTLSSLLDIWVEPHFQLWGRIGDGAIFSATRASHTVTAREAGRLRLASYFPGEWKTPDGILATPPEQYAGVSGGMSVFVVRWRRDALAGLRALPGDHPSVRLEIERLENPVVPPRDWKYLWFLGDAEIYTGSTGTEPEIHCHTHADVGILQKEVDAPLDADTTIAWDWRVDSLPSDLPEDTLPTHDYLSIAVEFDDGIDLTWYWSASLAPETGYWCPLPTWAHREYHVAIRSGAKDLGTWCREERNVHRDYRDHIGAPPRRIVRVWLIANSMFQRADARCRYRRIRIRSGATEIVVL